MNSLKRAIPIMAAVIYFGLSTVFAQEKYFQQEVNSTIHVTLDDENHFLYGNIDINYRNNSKDTLKVIRMHLWPNGYANNETELGREKLKDNPFYDKLEKEETRGFIDSLGFYVNNRTVFWESDSDHIDICRLVLHDPLLPGENANIKTPFRVKIPAGSISRLGHKDQTYSITQWFPKPAVYDQFGWHDMPYRDMGEFYSEFGKYDVFITAPKNYRIAATGVLNNPEETAWLDSLAMLNPDSTDLDTVFDSAPQMKTLHFSESNIHDFAWFASKNYHVQKSEVQLENGQTVTTWTMYSDASKDSWKYSTRYVNDAVYYYSKWNGNYPYKNCTAVEGPLTAGGGMEYPTITVIGRFGDTLRLEEVIMHEVGHNWFYGLFGSNERRYPFMDEGINSANEQRYMATKYPKHNMGSFIPNPFLVKLTELDQVPYYRFKEIQYLLNEKRNYDQPLDLHSDQYTNMNYGVIVYAKGAHMFNHLRQYLGNDTYDSIFHNYYKDFRFKHVYPDDLETLMNKGTDKDLDWFYKDWLSTRKRSDYAVKKIKYNLVLVENTKKVKSPFLLQAVKDDETVASKWVDGFDNEQWIDLQTGSFDKVYIDKEGSTYDFNRHNNYAKNKGLFKKTEPLQLKLIAGLDHDFRTEIYYIPFASYTVTGGVMPGIKLHNRSIFQKIVEYELTPMYSFKKNNITGSAKLDFFIPFRTGFIRTLRVNNIGFQYPGSDDDPLRKIASDINIEFRDALINNHEFYAYTVNTVASGMADTLFASPNATYYNNTGFTYRNRGPKYPYRVNIDVETMVRKNISPINKISLNADMAYRFAPKRTLDIHVYASLIPGSQNIPVYYQHHLSGTNDVTDYKYDYLFIDRYQSGKLISGNQFINDKGGFSINSPEAISDTWVSTLNLSYSLHRFIRPYVNAAFYSYANDNANERFAYEAGIRLGIRDVAEIYLPLYYDELMQTNPETAEVVDIYRRYQGNITLMLNLNKLDVFKIMKRMLPY